MENEVKKDIVEEEVKDNNSAEKTTVEVENIAIEEENKENLATEMEENSDAEEVVASKFDEEESEIQKLRNSPESKWYVLHTFSGYEQVAKDNLEIVIEKFNLEKRIFDIIIPMEDVIEERNGKKKLVSKKVMPCYLLVKMIYGDDLWHNVIRTRGITGFVGPKGRPLSLTEEEIRKMRLEKVNVEVKLEIGDKIEVIDGPLMGTVGDVIKVDAANNRVKVNVEMFGRETPIDLDFTQVRKI
jgi:transcriptional antiterminator NusG